MLRPVAQALTGLPFPDPIPEHLADEFDGWPARRRRMLARKFVQRELLIALSGQGRYRVQAAPAGTKRVLWHYTWTTIGDAIMDLAARTLLPEGVEMDLLICPALAPLFEQDRRIGKVYTDPLQCEGQAYDLLLLHHYSTEAVAIKRRHFPRTRFASVLEHRPGEMFSRLHYGDARIRQLFGLRPGAVARPTLTLSATEVGTPGRTHVAVALGARDERRRYGGWPRVLEQCVSSWPEERPPPLFHLLGTANARPDLAAIAPEWLGAHAVNHVEALSLQDTARCIAGCDAFMGTDGGLMHVAVALGRPGAAFFSAVPPAYRLLDNASVAPVLSDDPDALAQALVDRVRRAGLAPHAGNALHDHA
jgi:hypothetical protein